jgi:hypothetical protein
MVSENRGRSQNGKLEVAKLGLYWFIGRRQSDFEPIRETIVESFGQAPICTHRPCEAMLVAEGLSCKFAALFNWRAMGAILINGNSIFSTWV